MSAAETWGSPAQAASKIVCMFMAVPCSEGEINAGADDRNVVFSANEGGRSVIEIAFLIRQVLPRSACSFQGNVVERIQRQTNRPSVLILFGGEAIDEAVDGTGGALAVGYRRHWDQRQIELFGGFQPGV